MDRWPPPNTVYERFTPPEQAHRLRARFLERAALDLSADETEYTRTCGDPLIEIGRTPEGERVLRVTWGGSQTTTEWDGTFEDALATVDETASTAAHNVSSDYWLAGGWQRRTLSTGEDP